MPKSSQTSPDPGAGVFSLTQIRHLMRVEFSRAQRYGYPVSCIQLSVDRAGHFRDLYGYEFREAVIDSVTEMLQSATRNCDYLGRLMDDRLMAILPHTTREGAEVTAKRVLSAARNLGFEAEGRALQVTLSVGISNYESENTLFFDSLVEAAESALVEAIESGGDRHVYREPGSDGAR